MIDGKSVIAVIPARGGSKGLPGKNIKLLCGKPLIAWSIKAGLDSRYIDTVVVTTDSREIADIALMYGAEVPFLRPVELATDASTTFDAVKHTLNYYQDELQKKYDYLVLLEPTSPLREDDDIDNMLNKLQNKIITADSIISIGEVHEHPSIMKRIDGEMLLPYITNLVQTTRRQDNSPAYFPYGVAYITKVDVFFKEKTFYTSRSCYYKIKRYQCYEIDDFFDFISIEGIMNYRKENE